MTMKPKDSIKPIKYFSSRNALGYGLPLCTSDTLQKCIYKTMKYLEGWDSSNPYIFMKDGEHKHLLFQIDRRDNSLIDFNYYLLGKDQ